MKNKKVRQYRSRQGRSDRKYTNSLITLMISLVGLIIIMLIIRWF